MQIIYLPSEKYLGKLRERYRKACKTGRGRTLDEFVASTFFDLMGSKPLRAMMDVVHWLDRNALSAD